MTNDVQQVQLLVLVDSTMFVAEPITMIGGIIMALRTDLGLSWLVRLQCPFCVLDLSHHQEDGSTVPVDADPNGCGQPHSPRADHGHSGGRAFVREPYEKRGSRAPTPSSPTSPRRWDDTWRSIFPIVMFILNVSSVAVLWFGGDVSMPVIRRSEL